jgi:hypothetical protein
VTTINCTVEEKGVRCSTTLEVTEPMSPQFRFICKNHPRSVQVRANGRQYDPAKDEKDKDLHFQEYQFDKDFKRGAKPVSTSHLHNQGSEVMDSDAIKAALLAFGIER